MSAFPHDGVAGRRATGRLAALLCALLAAAAGAGELEYFETFEKALEAAEKGRLLVMVVIVAPGTDVQGRDVCKLLREETLPEEQIAKIIRQHFAPFLLDIALVRAGKLAVPPAVQACFKPNEQLSIPTLLFLDPKGKEVDRLVGYGPPPNYIGQIRKVAEKAAALVPEKERRDAQRAFERGKEAAERKDYAAALEALQGAAGLAGPDAEAAKALLEDIQGKAGAKFLEAENLETQQKLGSALRAYRDCARTFRGTEAATRAAARIAAIRQDPEVRKKLSTHMAGQLLAKAQDAIQRKQYGVAVEALETIAQRYPEAEQAGEARKLHEQLKADPQAARALRDAAARAEALGLLSVGDSFRRNGLPDKALAEYRKVVEKFPDTTYAQTAQQRIADLGK